MPSLEISGWKIMLAYLTEQFAVVILARTGQRK
jgi:hypothetical protein